MAKRRPNWRAIKIHHNYTVDEAARALGVAKITVRRWIKDKGLPVLQDRKPVLILGGDLIDFGAARARPKQRCGFGELYCVKCRAPRGPAGGMVEYLPLHSDGGNLRAICGVCETLMHRRVSLRQLSDWEAILEVSRAQALPHLMKQTDPCLNDHLHEERCDGAKASP
jgi:excisionase family DNA binding protein